MTVRRSNRGIQVDFDALIASQQASPAVGNMRVNAQGDVLGKGGKVVQKNEERVRAYYKSNPRSSTASASLKGDLPAAKLTPDVPKTADVKTAATAKPNKPTPAPIAEPTEFDAPVEPIGYREVTLPNGDIEMVPVYKSDE
jgi:hypothetical protein